MEDTKIEVMRLLRFADQGAMIRKMSHNLGNEGPRWELSRHMGGLPIFVAYIEQANINNKKDGQQQGTQGHD